LKNNAESLPDFGLGIELVRAPSTAFVESAVNQIIDKRMSKSKQMRWSPQSAHLLLQVRIRVIDGRLRQDFERWYPGSIANGRDPPAQRLTPPNRTLSPTSVFRRVRGAVILLVCGMAQSGQFSHSLTSSAASRRQTFTLIRIPYFVRNPAC
jgi:hypothetical protein